MTGEGNIACESCGRAIFSTTGHDGLVWLAVKGVERGYDPLTCDASDGHRHDPGQVSPHYCRAPTRGHECGHCHQHDWKRWDSFGDYGWHCRPCGANADEDPIKEPGKSRDERGTSAESADVVSERACPLCGLTEEWHSLEAWASHNSGRWYCHECTVMGDGGGMEHASASGHRVCGETCAPPVQADYRRRVKQAEALLVAAVGAERTSVMRALVDEALQVLRVRAKPGHDEGRWDFPEQPDYDWTGVLEEDHDA